MYNNWFFIEEPVWNNVFSFWKRKNKKIFVTNLKNIKNFWEIELWNEIVFEDFDFDWNLSSNKWLKNFYKIKSKKIKAPIYLFDNHNHAFYFWYKARKNWLIKDNNILYHIDEHSDLRDDKNYLLKPESENLQKVFDFTNFKLNVWNYIIPAKKEWIIWEIIQIRNEINLKDYLNWYKVSTLNKKERNFSKNIILNLDLDFFQPNLDYIDYNLKKKVILDIAKKASLITVSTSPFFVDQKLALKVFKDLFE